MHGQLASGSALAAFWLDAVRQYDCIKYRPNSYLWDALTEHQNSSTREERRGLRGVKLVISDAHEGLKAAVRNVILAN